MPVSNSASAAYANVEVGIDADVELDEGVANVDVVGLGRINKFSFEKLFYLHQDRSLNQYVYSDCEIDRGEVCGRSKNMLRSLCIDIYIYVHLQILTDLMMLFFLWDKKFCYAEHESCLD